MQAKKDDKPELARHLKSRHVQLIAIGGTIGDRPFSRIWSIHPHRWAFHLTSLSHHRWDLFSNYAGIG